MGRDSLWRYFTCFRVRGGATSFPGSQNNRTKRSENAATTFGKSERKIAKQEGQGSLNLVHKQGRESVLKHVTC